MRVSALDSSRGGWSSLLTFFARGPVGGEGGVGLLGGRDGPVLADQMERPAIRVGAAARMGADRVPRQPAPLAHGVGALLALDRVDDRVALQEFARHRVLLLAH